MCLLISFSFILIHPATTSRLTNAVWAGEVDAFVSILKSDENNWINECIMGSKLYIGETGRPLYRRSFPRTRAPSWRRERRQQLIQTGHETLLSPHGIILNNRWLSPATPVQKFIFKIGSLNPHGINGHFSFNWFSSPWRSANARNVSSRISSRWPIHIIKSYQSSWQNQIILTTQHDSLLEIYPSTGNSVTPKIVGKLKVKRNQNSEIQFQASSCEL